MLTKLIETYFIHWSIFSEYFLLKYFAFNDLCINLVKIIHHEQIDKIFNEIKFKLLSSLLQNLLKFVRQSIPSTEKSTFSFNDQVLQFNLEQFRFNTITFEHYERFKEKLSNLFLFIIPFVHK
jgi:hypothetical protein